MNFLDDFIPPDFERWKAKITADLKGDDLSSLVWESEIGPIDPVLHSFDTKNSSVPHLSASDNSWLIQFAVSGADPIVANKKILKALQGGANAIKVIHPVPSHLTTIFKDVMVEIITVQLVTHLTDYKDLQTEWQKILDDRGLDANALRYAILTDPLEDIVLKKGITENLLPDCRCDFMVDASLYGNGATKVDHQIALALAHGHEYIVNLLENGVSPAQLGQHIEFCFAIGPSYFLEIAKIRAFRIAWQKIVSSYAEDVHTVVSTPPLDVKVHGKTSQVHYASEAIHSNLLRATTATMSGIIGGYTSLEVVPYDSNTSDKKEDADRLARNIQLILQEEAHMNTVQDPAAGSYYVASITQKLMERSWELFQRIEAEGGFIKAYKTNFITDLINSDSMS